MVLDILAGMLRAVGKRVMEWNWAGSRLVVSADSTVKSACCPSCGRRSRRRHGHYRRLLTECPCLGHPVSIDMEMRRFQCRNRSCSRQTFAEQVEELALPRQRCTNRLAMARRSIALALGGKAGARLAELLGMRASGDTLLRLLQRSPPSAAEEPLTAIGIDDWAFARGHRYGTVVVDLERRRPIALLPDRDTTTVSAWLKGRDGIQVVARDRASAYAEAVDQVLPDATQVADRWHLIKNLRNALERVVSKMPSRLREAAKAEPATTSTSMESPEKQIASKTSQLRIPAHQQRVESNRARRLARYEEVVRLHAAGRSITAIAREMGLDRHTVRHFANAPSFPERLPRATLPSRLDAMKPYLRARAAEGCTNAAQVRRELLAQGFKIGRSRLQEAFRPLRLAVGSMAPASALPSMRMPSPIQVCGWLLGWKVRRGEEQCVEARQHFITRLCELEPAVATARDLALRFIEILRDHDSIGLENWFTQASRCSIIEMHRFAAGLQADLSAVRAAVALLWSSGQVEGQINRLKYLKRQMYGRAGLQLLAARVINRA